jgi:glutamate-1-semialdehyde 2,1-aminomutase
MNDTSPIEERYVDDTLASAAMIRRAQRCMPAGSTRTFGFHLPYQTAFHHGNGPYLWDVDGRRYVDLVYNGLSLIHGHSYPPVTEALLRGLSRGTAWPGPNDEQVRFAELLRDRVQGVELIRFANTGSEAAMLAVKIARHVTGRPLVLKAWHGYHGCYPGLEAGLEGAGETSQTVLADFGDTDSFARTLERFPGRVAAVILEPVMFTGVVTPPPPGFLQAVEKLAHEAGALFILDDCLMLRLSYHGCSDLFGLQPDLTVLGKFIGGGLPVGAVGGPAEIMNCLDPTAPDHIYHGGSFNGNLLGSTAGRTAMEHLTRDRITQMNQHRDTLEAHIRASAEAVGVPLSVNSFGSIMGIYMQAEPPLAGQVVETPLQHEFHLACLNNGIYLGPGGECAMATVITDDVIDFLAEAFENALKEVAEVVSSPVGLR